MTAPVPRSSRVPAGFRSCTIRSDMTYIHDPSSERERERLAELEAAFDSWEQRLISELDVQRGWRCLDVGAGGGSMSVWLSTLVGEAGQVVATDIDTRFMQALGRPNIEVREHDITEGAPDPCSFDLIHARAVLEHVPDRRIALRNMFHALKPGGWLAVSAADFGTFYSLSEADDPEFQRIGRRFLAFAEANGFDLHLGRRLRGELLALGLLDLRCEGRAIEWGGELAPIWAPLFEQLSDQVVSEGLLDRRDADWIADRVRAPDFRAFGPLVVSVRARRPE